MSCLEEPATVIEVRLIIGGRETNSPEEMALRFGSIVHGSVDDAEIDLERGVVGRVDKGSLEVVECDGIIALFHLCEAVVHETSAVVWAFLHVVEPKSLFCAPDHISLMGSVGVSGEKKHYE